MASSYTYTAPDDCSSKYGCKCNLHRSQYALDKMLSREKRKRTKDVPKIDILEEKKTAMVKAFKAQRGLIRATTDSAMTARNITNNITANDNNNINTGDTNNFNSINPIQESNPIVEIPSVSTPLPNETIEEALIREFEINLRRSANDMYTKTERQRLAGSDCGKVYINEFKKFRNLEIIRKISKKRKHETVEEETKDPEAHILRILSGHRYVIMYDIIKYSWCKIMKAINGKNAVLQDGSLIGDIIISKELFRVLNSSHIPTHTEEGKATIDDIGNQNIKISYLDFDYKNNQCRVNFQYDDFDEIAVLQKVDGAMLSSMTIIPGIYQTMKDEMLDSHQVDLEAFKKSPLRINRKERNENMMMALFEYLQQ